jgi:hypothetical protein
MGPSSDVSEQGSQVAISTTSAYSYPVMGPLELTEEQEAELRRFLGVYKRETERCRKAKAYQHVPRRGDRYR